MTPESLIEFYEHDVAKVAKKKAKSLAKGKKGVLVGPEKLGFRIAFDELGKFKSFAKKKKANSFDVGVDFMFTSFLMMEEIPGFYSYMSRLLNFNGTLYTVVHSTDSEYCKEHCPKRRWTIKDGIYIKYFTKAEIQTLLKKRFSIVSYNKLKLGTEIFHEIVAKQKLRKIIKWKK